MSDFTQTRSEYLKIMMGDRKKALAPYRPEGINDLGDTSFDVASLSDVDIDNAINLMSGTQYENSDVFKAFQDEKANRAGKSESDRPKSWLENVGDFFSNIGTSITEGIFNVMDDVWDFGVGVTAGLFGGGWFGAKNDFTDWAAEAMTDDRWIAYATKGATQFDVFDKGFWTNEGGYWTDWSYENIQKEQARDYEGMEWLHKGGNFIGEMIPSLLLTYFTGGANLGVTAAAQGGLSFARGMGSGQSTALSQGADFQKAALYGVAEGGVGAALSALSVGVGGTLAKEGGNGIVKSVGQKFGKLIGDKFGSETARVLADKAAQIGLRSLGSAGSAALRTTFDPALQMIYDENAWYNAYGTDENRAKYGEIIAKSALTAAAGSAIVNTGRELFSVARAGSFERYKENYFADLAKSETMKNMSRSERRDFIRSQREYLDNQKEITEIQKKVDAMRKEGQSDSEIQAYVASKMEVLAPKIETWTDKYQDLYLKLSFKVGNSLSEAQSKLSDGQLYSAANKGANQFAGMLSDIATESSLKAALIKLGTSVASQDFDYKSNPDGSGQASIGAALISYKPDSDSIFFQSKEEPSLPKIEAKVVDGKAVLAPTSAKQMQTLAAIASDPTAMTALPDEVALPLKDGSVNVLLKDLDTPEQVKKLALLEKSDLKVSEDGTKTADLGGGKSLVISADGKSAEIISSMQEQEVSGNKPLAKNDGMSNNAVEYGNDFRELQKASRGMPDQESASFHSGERDVDEKILGRLSAVLSRELDARSRINGYGDESHLKTQKGTEFDIYTRVDAKTFHDVFEIARTYLRNGELVDLHQESDYEGSYNCLTKDGLGGFSITKDGDLVSVFNLNSKKKGFLYAIKGEIQAKAKTLDCYVSPKQPLNEIYSKTFGFKTASLMDWNPEYDHDDIGKNHGEPKVAFMVNHLGEVPTKHFGKDEYDEAKAYQLKYALDLQNFASKKEAVSTNATPSEVKQMAEGKEGKVYSLSSVNSTIDAIKDSIQGLLSLDNLGGETKLNLPKNATARDVFNALNIGNDEQKVAAKANLKNQLLNMEVDYKLKDYYGDELESYSGTWKDFLATMSKEEIAKFDSDFDEFFDELVASGDDSKVSKLISAYGSKISEMANAHSELKAQTKLHGHIEKHKVKILNRYYHNDGADFGPGFDFDTKGFKVLLEPLHELQETNGKQSYTGSSAHEGLVKFLDNYKLENFSKTTIDDGSEIVEVSSIYNQGLRDLASTLLTSIEDNSYTDKNGKVIYRALNSNQLSMLRAFQDEVEQMPKRAATDAVEAVSSAKAAYYGIERYISKFLKNGEIGIVRRFIQEYSDRYANQLDDIRYRLGDNALTKAIYDELYLSASQARGMEDDFQGKINTVREKESVSNKKLNSLSSFKDTNGKSIENRYLVRVYQNLMAGVDSNNVKYLEANTVYIKDSKDRIKHVAKFSYADKEAIENDLKKVGFLEYTKGLHKIENKDLGDVYESDSVRDSHLPNSNRLEDYTAIELESNQSELGKAYIKSGVVSNGHQRDRVTNIPKGVHLVIRDAETAIMKQVHNQANIHFNNPVLKKINAMLNTKIDNDGKTVKEYLTQNNRGAVELINRAVNGAYGINDNKQHKLIDFVGNGYVMSLIGLNPSSILKQPLSIFWSNDISMASVLKFSVGANLNPVVWKNTSRLIEEIEKEFPELKLRGKKNEALMGNTSSDNIGKVQKAIGKIAGAGLKMADAWTVGHEAIGVLSLQGQQLGYGNVGTAENDAYVKTHYRAFLATQVSSNGLTMSGARAGYYGSMGKFTSFMTGAVQGQIGHLLRAAQQVSEFAGKDQQFYDSLIERTKADEESAKNAYEESKTALEQTVEDYNNNLADKDDVKEAKENLKNAFDKFTRASGERTDAEESAKAFRHFKDMGGAKGVILDRIVGALLTGISLVAINELASRLKGQKRWDEFDASSAGTDLAINTLGGWLPVARDLVNAWKGYDLEIPEYAMMKQAYTLVTAISNAAQNPSDKTARALMRQAIESASAFLGIPTTNLWKYANGIIKTFSPSTAIEMNNLLYGASPTTLAKNAKEYAEKNDISTSADLYQSLYSLSKTGEISREVAVEESKLVAEGFNPIARNIPDYVQGDGGERVVLTDDQRSDFSKVYSEANKQVENLIKSAKYKNATSEVKAKEIKKVYDLYYEVARYKSLGTDPDSKLGKLLAYASNYDDDVIATILLIQQNSQLVDNARSTKKEQAIKLVNQQTMSKNQKLLVLYLMGYGVSEDNKKVVRNYLISLGFTKKQAEEFLPTK